MVSSNHRRFLLSCSIVLAVLLLLPSFSIQAVSKLGGKSSSGIPNESIEGSGNLSEVIMRIVYPANTTFEPGKPIGIYVVASLPNGTPLTGAMARSEILDPIGRSLRLELEEIQPGIYAGEMLLNSTIAIGEYRVMVVLNVSGIPHAASKIFWLSYIPERPLEIDIVPKRILRPLQNLTLYIRANYPTSTILRLEVEGGAIYPSKINVTLGWNQEIYRNVSVILPPESGGSILARYEIYGKRFEKVINLSSAPYPLDLRVISDYTYRRGKIVLDSVVLKGGRSLTDVEVFYLAVYQNETKLIKARRIGRFYRAYLNPDGLREVFVVARGSYGLARIEVGPRPPPPIIIERYAPRKVKPRSRFEVKLSVDLGSNLTGKVEIQDRIPRSFRILSPVQREFRENYTLIRWILNLSGKRFLNISYILEAPSEWPSRYYLGPASVLVNESIYNESRPWLIVVADPPLSIYNIWTARDTEPIDQCDRVQYYTAPDAYKRFFPGEIVFVNLTANVSSEVVITVYTPNGSVISNGSAIEYQPGYFYYVFQLNYSLANGTGYQVVARSYLNGTLVDITSRSFDLDDRIWYMDNGYTKIGVAVKPFVTRAIKGGGFCKYISIYPGEAVDLIYSKEKLDAGGGIGYIYFDALFAEKNVLHYTDPETGERRYLFFHNGTISVEKSHQSVSVIVQGYDEESGVSFRLIRTLYLNRKYELVLVSFEFTKNLSDVVFYEYADLDVDQQSLNDLAGYSISNQSFLLREEASLPLRQIDYVYQTDTRNTLIESAFMLQGDTIDFAQRKPSVSDPSDETPPNFVVVDGETLREEDVAYGAYFYVGNATRGSKKVLLKGHAPATSLLEMNAIVQQVYAEADIYIDDVTARNLSYSRIENVSLDQSFKLSADVSNIARTNLTNITLEVAIRDWRGNVLWTNSLEISFLPYAETLNDLDLTQGTTPPYSDRWAPGVYEIEVLAKDSFGKLLYSASGYFRVLAVPKANITELSTDRTIYGYESDVRITVVSNNTGNVPLNLSLRIAIGNSTHTLYSELVHIGVLDVLESNITLIVWNTDDYAPGTYCVNVTLFNQTTIFDEKSTCFRVSSRAVSLKELVTRNSSSFEVLQSFGDNANLTITVDIWNSGKEPLENITLFLTIFSPNGSLVKAVARNLSYLGIGEIVQDLSLTMFYSDLNQPGAYTLNLTVLDRNGTLLGQLTNVSYMVGPVISIDVNPLSSSKFVRVNFTLILENLGLSPAENVTIRVMLPPDFTNVTSSDGVVEVVGGYWRITWDGSIRLSEGESISLTFNATAPDVGVYPILANVTCRFSAWWFNSSEVFYFTVSGPKLIEIRSVPSTVGVDRWFQVDLLIYNDGDLPAYPIQVDEYLSYSNLTAKQFWNVSSNSLDWLIDGVPADEVIQAGRYWYIVWRNWSGSGSNITLVFDNYNKSFMLNISAYGALNPGSLLTVSYKAKVSIEGNFTFMGHTWYLDELGNLYVTPCETTLVSARRPILDFQLKPIRVFPNDRREFRLNVTNIGTDPADLIEVIVTVPTAEGWRNITPKDGGSYDGISKVSWLNQPGLQPGEWRVYRFNATSSSSRGLYEFLVNSTYYRILKSGKKLIIIPYESSKVLYVKVVAPVLSLSRMIRDRVFPNEILLVNLTLENLGDANASRPKLLEKVPDRWDILSDRRYWLLDGVEASNVSLTEWGYLITWNISGERAYARFNASSREIVWNSSVFDDLPPSTSHTVTYPARAPLIPGTYIFSSNASAIDGAWPVPNSYYAWNSSYVTVIRPILELERTMNTTMYVGITYQVELTLANTGSSTAYNCTLSEFVPEGFYIVDPGNATVIAVPGGYVLRWNSSAIGRLNVSDYRTLSYSVRPEQEGIFYFGPANWSYEDLAGTVYNGTEGYSTEVRVMPRAAYVYNVSVTKILQPNDGFLKIRLVARNLLAPSPPSNIVVYDLVPNGTSASNFSRPPNGSVQTRTGLVIWFDLGRPAYGVEVNISYDLRIENGTLFGRIMIGTDPEAFMRMKYETCERCRT